MITDKNLKNSIAMLNKGNDQEIEKNFMTMRIQDNKENKNTQKEILMNLKETMINLTKIGNKVNFHLLKMRKR